MTFNKANLKELKAEGTKLEKKVINMLLDQGTTEEIENHIKDVLQHGCQSGIVPGLIYYHDTLEFYSKYKKDIVNLLSEAGIQPSDLNGWDNEDPFAEDTSNQNILAWFGYEETVYRIASHFDLA